LYYGAQNSSQVATNLARIEQFVATSVVLECNTETARLYGHIKAGLRARGRPIPENDIWIAAIALQHDVAILSRDEHFNEVDKLELETW
jgi:tRNA(fMet)-specific endonuclease VapC